MFTFLDLKEIMTLERVNHDMLQLARNPLSVAHLPVLIGVIKYAGFVTHLI